MQFLKKRNLLNNKIQRGIFLFFLLAELVVAFVHFPFIGYYDVYNYECSAAYGVIGGQPKCIETSLKSPFDWVSKGALLHWFGDMTNFLCTVIFIFVAGLLCLVFFKSTPGDLKKDEEDVMSDHSDR